MKSRALFLLCTPLLFGEEILLETEFREAEGYQNGTIHGQHDWLASPRVTVDGLNGTVTLSEAFDYLNLSSSVELRAWDRITLTAVVQMDFALDVNQTPLRLGLTTSVNQNGDPIPLPTGNSTPNATVLAAEFFREGYPFLQTQNAAHHQGTITFSPYSGASHAQKIALTGGEAGIYPHARMAIFTSQNGGPNTEEIQYLAAVPLFDTPELTAEDAYRLTYQGEETGDLFRGSPLSEITAALESFSQIGRGNVTITGDFTEGYEITFGGVLLGEDLAQLGVIEPSRQDHLTQRMEVTYDLLKRAEGQKYEITISLKNLDTGIAHSLPATTLTDTHSHTAQNYYVGLRAGNLPKGGSLTIESFKVLRSDRDRDSDGDGFSNLQELSAGTDPLSLKSTPLFEGIFTSSFSTGPEPLNNSPHWRAEPDWNISTNQTASISPLQSHLALTEEPFSIEVGEAIYTTTEFRLTGPANYALMESSLFSAGISDQSDPTNAALSAEGTLYSSPLNQGTFLFDALDLGSAENFYDLAGYDATNLEELVQGSPRTSGPSDWMKIEHMIVKNEEPGSFTKRIRITDLEGATKGTWQIETIIFDAELWGRPELRTGFATLASVSSQIVTGAEVRSHLSLLINANDYDADRLTNHHEVFYGTSSRLQDTDGDLQADWYELINGSDPLNENSFIENIEIITTQSSIENYGTVQFNLTGPPGKDITVQSSRDLVNWQATSFLPRTISNFGEASILHYFDFDLNNALFFRVEKVTAE